MFRPSASERRSDRYHLRPEGVDGGAVAVDRADVVVPLAGLHAHGTPTTPQIGVDQRADVLVAAVGLAPQRVQRPERGRRHAEGAPYPVRTRMLGLDLDRGYHAVDGQDRVEPVWLVNREQQERQLVLR